MAVFRPKEVFQKAQEAERQGDLKRAAAYYASLSAYLRRRGKHEEALTLIQRAISLAPRMLRLRLQLAICAEIKGETAIADQAVDGFTDAVFKSGKVDEFRGIVESALKDYPRLRQQFFAGVLRLDRTAAPPFLGRAAALREQGDDAGALKVLLDALQTGTHRAKVIEALDDLLRSAGRSEALIHLGRFREGKVTLENLLVLLSGSPREGSQSEISSGSGKALRDLIHELEKDLGIDLENPQNEVQPLLQEFRRRSQPILGADAKARMDMALAFFEMGLTKEAQDELAVVKETDRLYSEAQVLLGEILLSVGSELAALDAFQRCLRSSSRTDESEREARYKLIQVFFRLGDMRQAFNSATELEKIAPNYRDLRLLMSQIREAMDRQQSGKSID